MKHNVVILLFFLFSLPLFHLQFSLVIAGNELWPMDRPDGMPNIVSLEVMCGKDHMDVHLTFSHPFEGIVSSKGAYHITQCRACLAAILRDT